MRTCRARILKLLLFTFNFIFAISGIGLILAGFLVLSEIRGFIYFIEGNLIAPAITMIGVGVIVFIVAFLGCYGALRERRRSLNIFAGILFIMFLIELGLGIVAVAYKSEFEVAMKNTLKYSLGKYYDDVVYASAWDVLQSQVKCCGVDEPTDWPENKRPKSCCRPVKNKTAGEKRCQAATIGDDHLYRTGCYEKLKTKVNSNADIIIIMGVVIAIIELIRVGLAIDLVYKVKHEQEEMEF